MSAAGGCPCAPTESGGTAQEHLRSFRRVILAHYGEHGRDLPWRRTRDPYRILVSEIMLQQTQVSRVLRKYDDFLARFPDVWALAGSPIAAVPQHLAGPGIQPQRAGPAAGGPSGRLRLWRLASPVPGGTSLSSGDRPRDGRSDSSVRLRSGSAVHRDQHPRGLPPSLLPRARRRSPIDEIMPLVEATLDREDPRTWYYALMDYGSWLKQTEANPSRRSSHHMVQTPFAGSRRQLRAQVLRLFLRQGCARDRPDGRRGSLTAAQAATLLPGWAEAEVSAVLSRLAEEGFLKEDSGFSLR